MSPPMIHMGSMKAVTILNCSSSHTDADADADLVEPRSSGKGSILRFMESKQISETNDTIEIVSPVLHLSAYVPCFINC
ncbi:uncharacterized protein EAE98_004465 [Botrytis deweyae]|uniref:Uncharacterized protein n=1 Tax=Botrytis deweyae TaxID=2478750 RepID=A0ABQ7IRS8_9HELO|nr:uncharacterized protein EAE98_004465 [Botrytis deweyae]KAF7931729.1 hypothetical protein EAE98_004465 [Botrytis deweyae]